MKATNGKLNFLKGIMGFVLTLAMVFSAFGMSVLADEAAAITAAESTQVYIRVEACSADSNATLLPRTSILVENFDMLAYGAEANPEAATALQALITAVGEEITFSYSAYGVYITEILGVEDDGAHSWMYSVNNESLLVGSDAYEIQAGDEIVFYYISWQDGSYASFDQNEVVVAEGNVAEFTLTGNNYMDGDFAVADATILISERNGDAAWIATEYTTDENGNVTVEFATPGFYMLSATRTNEEGVVDISRPLAIITVVRGDEYRILYIEDGNHVIAGNLVVQADVDAVMENDVVYIPLRAVATQFGMDVAWDAEQAMATVTFGDRAVDVRLHNDEDILLTNDRILVPTEFFMEHFLIRTEFVFGVAE